MTQTAPSSKFRTVGTGLAVAVLAAVGLLKFSQTHALGQDASRRKAEVEAGPRVRTLTVGGQSGEASFSFQGEALPMASTTLYAKIGGFIKEIRVDKGSRVQKGELLAVIESPETEKATLALKANYDNLQRTADKYVLLGRERVISNLDVDNAQAAAAVAKESWLAQKQMEAYERLTAPYAGIVTARFVDPGAFIQNASSSLASQQLVTVADVSRLRVTFFLDQATAAHAKVGQEVEVSPTDRPDQVSKARLSRVAGALDVRTRTMLAEADLDNRDGKFMGGGYVRVAFRLPRDPERLEIPSEALILKGNKTFVASVATGQVRLLEVTLGDDAGSRVRVLQGLAAGTKIIMNPSPLLVDGDRVQVME